MRPITAVRDMIAIAGRQLHYSVVLLTSAVKGICALEVCKGCGTQTPKQPTAPINIFSGIHTPWNGSKIFGFDSIRFDSNQFDSIRFDSIRFDSIRFGSVRFDSIRFDSIRFDSIRFDSIRFDSIRN
ncbi:unnamed protein product [Toxocara canis]|uniref:Pentapeptide repeat-containing protein n=1 Tax=Toxocara canis TaxID=6265 RepID=A0A183V2G6_TOXCA|nr:unnamed protein product [Toxocara canis]